MFSLVVLVIGRLLLVALFDAAVDVHGGFGLAGWVVMLVRESRA
jgi:hypothetical protein